MKRTILLSVLLIFTTGLFAQDTLSKLAKGVKKVDITHDSVKPWKFHGFGSLTLNQAYFANWAAGGENSVGLTMLVKLQLDYKKKRHSWITNLDFAYGSDLKAPGSAAEQLRKTDDRLELNSVYGYAISKHWDVSVIANFKTQVAKGYNYPDDSTIISRWMSPGYLIAGLGVTWRPASSFSVFISPLSSRSTFVIDNTLAKNAAFGVDSNQHYRGEFGAYLRAALNQDLAKNINITSTLDLYTNYLKDFGAIDVNWNVLLTMKVNKWLAATISTALIYDQDIMITDQHGEVGPRTQFKENIGVGLSYKFN